MEANLISRSFEESLKAKKDFFTVENIALVERAALEIVASFKAGGKLITAGNGGSAADAQHMAAELVNRFEIERPPLPALAITTDTSNITSIANDYSFDEVFSKQIRALGKTADILMAISTSGASANITKAAETARAMGIKVIALTGKGGGELASKSDIVLNVDAKRTCRVQEVHITICHILSEIIDSMLFKNV
jgi:phosphoheptose isomerase